jgi:universal stress protein E
MFELSKVLVVIDIDHEHQLTLDRLKQLAKLADFEVRLISCDYSRYLVEGYYFDGVQIPELRRGYLQERKEALEALAAPLRDSGLQTETEAIWGHPPFEAIVHDVLDYQPDLVIHSARRHSRLSRIFLSNEDWQLVRTCPAPLLLVKEKMWRNEPVIIAAVDPKHSHGKPMGLDHKILRVANDVSEKLGGLVYIMHSFSEIPMSGKYPEAASKEHRKAMADLLNDFDIPENRVCIIDESVEFALPELELDLQADLVVMGAISRSRLADVFIGNTAEKVLDYLESDVLIVKPEGYVSPIEHSTE